MMKRSIPVLIFLIGMICGGLCVRFAFPQKPSHPPESKQTADELAKDLSLDDDQKEQLTKISSTFDQKVSELFFDASRRFSAMRAEHDEKIISILNTEEQKEKFEEMSKEWREHDVRNETEGRLDVSGFRLESSPPKYNE